MISLKKFWTRHSVSQPDGVETALKISAEIQAMQDSSEVEQISENNLSPLRLVIVTSVTIFVVEFFVMLLFLVVPPLPLLVESVIDATLLVSIMVPVLYFFWYRPMSGQIQERHQINIEIRRRALHDALTSLPNRYLFQYRLQHELEISRREKLPFAIILLDVCRLNEINNTLGHSSGDALLRQIADRLKEFLRESDSVARFGADIFGLLLRTINVDRAIYAAEKLHEIIRPPFIIADIPIEIEICLGISLFPEHGDSSIVLLQRADIALQNAKNKSEDYCVYTVESDSNTKRRLALSGILRNSIQNNELVLYYQPKIDINTGHVAGAEALVRWQHPDLGVISPNEFIPLAEQTSLIKPLTIWVIEEAIRQIDLWKEDISIPIAINLSARNLVDVRLPQHVAEVLARWNVSPKMLTVEVTESAIMANPQRAGEILEQLNRTGIMLSIDDFGTGYGSLTYLRTLPMGELKIDQSFVRDMEGNRNSLAIVQAVISLAQSLGLRVTAEGVSTNEILHRLQGLGCNMAQGYFIAQPLPAAEFLNWFKNYSNKGILGLEKD